MTTMSSISLLSLEGDLFLSLLSSCFLSYLSLDLLLNYFLGGCAFELFSLFGLLCLFFLSSLLLSDDTLLSESDELELDPDEDDYFSSSFLFF